MSKPRIYVTDHAFEYSVHRHGEVRLADGRNAARWRMRKELEAGGGNRPGRAADRSYNRRHIVYNRRHIV